MFCNLCVMVSYEYKLVLRIVEVWWKIYIEIVYNILDLLGR